MESAMYICVCKAVTDSQIVTAIENGVCTRKQLTHCFGIGRDCGKCNQAIIDLVAQTTASPDQRVVNTIINLTAWLVLNHS
jgi:bacterioferritin-associated ferredoxin